jgi:hypothetical protein
MRSPKSGASQTREHRRRLKQGLEQTTKQTYNITTNTNNRRRLIWESIQALSLKQNAHFVKQKTTDKCHFPSSEHLYLSVPARF